jgi:hypothetical protein
MNHERKGPEEDGANPRRIKISPPVDAAGPLVARQFLRIGDTRSEHVNLLGSSAHKPEWRTSLPNLGAKLAPSRDDGQDSLVRIDAADVHERAPQPPIFGA